MPCMKENKPLPEPYASLVEMIRSNHPDTGGMNRGAVAELDARLAIAHNRVATSLTYATWALVFVTVILVVVTLRAG